MSTLAFTFTVAHSRRENLHVISQSYQSTSRASNLRKLLDRPGVLQGPCCHDALSAKLIEDAGFPIAFMSGFTTSAARLGAPDTGLMSYGEMVDQGRYVNEATQHIPIIGDGDHGYGNAINVKRTVRGYASAGFAGILIEDQVAPKSCGHVRGKRVVAREEAVARIRAAVDAREEGADILIVARTDARQALSLEEALWRAAAFADAGADILFIDALESREEMRAFCGLAPSLPKMANNLEGGKTPLLGLDELEQLGFKLVAYPLSLLGVSIAAMQKALSLLKADVIPPPDLLPSFAELQKVIGFLEYYAEEERYATSSAGPPETQGPSPSVTQEVRALYGDPAEAGSPEGPSPGIAGSSAGDQPGAPVSFGAGSPELSRPAEQSAAVADPTVAPDGNGASLGSRGSGTERPVDAGGASGDVGQDRVSESRPQAVEADEIILPGSSQIISLRKGDCLPAL
eukprot:jgi/Botrbrau1/21779/Bobra.0190s0006.2